MESEDYDQYTELKTFLTYIYCVLNGILINYMRYAQDDNWPILFKLNAVVSKLYLFANAAQ